jgi:hypothetical protein
VNYLQLVEAGFFLVVLKSILPDIAGRTDDSLGNGFVIVLDANRDGRHAATGTAGERRAGPFPVALSGGCAAKRY